jgi:hypothetical protein
MFVVNFLGGYAVAPAVLRHTHTFCSFADTVMPQFFVAVGFALRLTFVRRAAEAGTAAAYRRAVGRGLALVLLGCVYHRLTGRYESWAELTAVPAGEWPLRLLKRGPFETLTHIGVTTLWVLPVLAAPGWARVLYTAGSGGLHALLSHAGYYGWNMTPPVGIDGGPLGFLTWTLPLAAGTLAHDWMTDGRPAGRRLVAAGVGLMVAGYALSLANRFTPPNDLWSAESWRHVHDGFPLVPPDGHFGPNYWTMSQRAGSVTYLLFAAGFALAVLAAFRWACDGRGLRVGAFGLFGRNALAGYIVHDMVMGAVKPFVPRDAPGWWVGVGFAAFLGLTTLFVRHLDRHRLYLRL